MGGHGGEYVVRRGAVPHDALLCALQCADCRVCAHTFSCSCTDHSLRASICKHVHFVVRLYGLGGLPPYAPDSAPTPTPGDTTRQHDVTNGDSLDGGGLTSGGGGGGPVNLVDSAILLNPDCHGAGARNGNKSGCAEATAGEFSRDQMRLD